MYVMEPPKSPRQTLKSPSYDVKIIAGRRVVIYHDEEQQVESQGAGSSVPNVKFIRTSHNGLQDQLSPAEKSHLLSLYKQNKELPEGFIAVNKDEKLPPVPHNNSNSNNNSSNNSNNNSSTTSTSTSTNGDSSKDSPDGRPIRSQTATIRSRSANRRAQTATLKPGDANGNRAKAKTAKYGAKVIHKDGSVTYIETDREQFLKEYHQWLQDKQRQEGPDPGQRRTRKNPPPRNDVGDVNRKFFGIDNNFEDLDVDADAGKAWEARLKAREDADKKLTQAKKPQGRAARRASPSPGPTGQELSETFTFDKKGDQLVAKSPAAKPKPKPKPKPKKKWKPTKSIGPGWVTNDGEVLRGRSASPPSAPATGVSTQPRRRMESPPPVRHNSPPPRQRAIRRPIFNPTQEKELRQQLQVLLRDVPDRSFDNILRELRRQDPDRDRIMPSDDVKFYSVKHVPVLDEVFDKLEAKYGDTDQPGFVNYEDMVQYLHVVKQQSALKEQEHQQMLEKQQEMIANQDARRGAVAQEDKSKTTSERPFSFGDREDAGLILELEKALLDSPKFSVEKFRDELNSKDHYGNDQISRPLINMAVDNQKLNIDRNVLAQLLMQCDPRKKGFYQISKICDYLERSQPHILEMRRQHSGSTGSLSSSMSSSLRSSQSFPIALVDKYVQAQPSWEKRKPLQTPVTSSTSTQFPISEDFFVGRPFSPQPQNLSDLVELRKAIIGAHQDIPGYLTEEELRHVWATYNTVYQMNISEGRLHEAIGNAKSMDPTTGLINIGLFYRFLEEAVKK